MGVAAYGTICFLSVVVLVGWMLWNYARPGTAPIVLVTVGLSWLLSFVSCFLLPIDLLPAQEGEDQQRHLETVWNLVYWSSFFLTWLIIPILTEYYNAGDFTVKGRLTSSLKSNLKFYLVVVILFVAFLIYMAATSEFGTEEIIGFLVCLGNTWGILLAILLLGYGLVEIPRMLWYEGDRSVRLKRVYYQASIVYSELEEAKELLTTTLNGLDKLESSIGSSFRPYIDVIRSVCPSRDEYDLSTVVGGVNLEPIKEVEDAVADRESLPKLINLHRYVKTLFQKLSLTQAQWNDVVEKACVLEELVGKQEGTCPISPADSNIFRRTLDNFTVRYKPFLTRCLSVIAATMSVTLIWAELTILSSTEISPFGVLYRSAEGNDGLIQFFTLLPLLYISLCAFFSMFQIRLSRYYHMHWNRGTEALSLLFNGSYLLRLFAPLAFNFLSILRVKKGTAFQIVIGKMAVIPFFGSSFNDIVPVLIAVFSLLTLCNVYGEILRFIGIQRFEYNTDLVEETSFNEGKHLLRLELRRRGISTGSDRKNLRSRDQKRGRDRRRLRGTKGYRDVDSDDNGSAKTFSHEIRDLSELDLDLESLELQDRSHHHSALL